MNLNYIKNIYSEIIFKSISVQKKSGLDKCIYTCNIGNFDNLIINNLHNLGFDIFVISDSTLDNIPEYITILNTKEIYRSKRRTNRVFKILPHLFFPTYSYSIYFDSNLSPSINIFSLFDLINNNNFFCFRHNKRNCVYDEIEECKFWNKDTTIDLDNQKYFYQAEGMPQKFGLFQGSVLVRKHNEMIHFSEFWYHQYEIGSARDQISLAYTIFKLNYIPETLNYNNLFDFFSKYDHVVINIHESHLNRFQKFRMRFLLILVSLKQSLSKLSFK